MAATKAHAAAASVVYRDSILALLRDGKAPQAIAELLGVTKNTVIGVRARARKAGEVIGEAQPAPRLKGTRNRTRTSTSNAESARRNLAKMRAEGKMVWHGPRKKHPPISEAEARRLIDEAVAAGKVTRCEPASVVVLPLNAGMGWR
jgi:hypothetical protein